MDTEEELHIFGVVDHSRMEAVVSASEEAFPKGATSVYKSGFDGQELLRIRTDFMDIETNQGSAELISGPAGNSVLDAQQGLKALSSALTARNVAHHFELYDAVGGLIEEYR